MSYQADPQALAGCSLFADVPVARIAELLRHATLQTLDPHATIYAQGDSGTTFCIVAHGTVELTRATPDGTSVLVYRGREGSVLGLLAALAAQPRATNAHALGDVTLWHWSAATYADAARADATLHANLLHYLGERYMHLWIRYSELRQLTVEQRLARTLMRLAARGTPTEQGMVIDLPFSRQDLADIIGTTIFSASRIMRRWERDGLIGGGRRRLLIHNLAALTQIGDGSVPADLPDEDRA